MTIYRILDHYQKKRRSFESTDEFEFYAEHRALLSSMKKFAFLHDVESDEFSIIRAVLILAAYLNKETIEKEMKNIAANLSSEEIRNRSFMSSLKEKLVDLSYFQDGNTRIYIPFFPRSLNLIYSEEPEKLLSFPYSELAEEFDGSTIDPFDTYGNRLFDSNFTRLIRVADNGREIAYFHYDTYTVYVVNAQGRLDTKIVLFDRFIRHPSYNHMIERIRPVMEAYFADDRELFIRKLLESGFISQKLVSILRKKDRK